MKKLNLGAKPQSYISIENRSRNSYCKTHCLKYDSFEFRNNNCFICCEQQECISNNEPLTKVELEALLNQLLQQTTSDEFKQQQKQKINSQREELTKEMETYCERMMQQMEKNCEQQNQQNQQIKQILENKEEGLNCQEVTEILKQQELDCMNVQISVHSTLSKNFHKILQQCEATLNYIHCLCGTNEKEEEETNVLKNKFEMVNAKTMTYKKLHEISIKQQKFSGKRIYQDQQNEQIIVICTGQDLNNQITLIKPSKYSLFGQFECLRNQIQAEVFCISPSGEYYAWGNTCKYQIYHTILKSYKTLTSNADIDYMAFSEINDFVISTIDHRINFWGLNDKNWEFKSSFNMLPERVHNLVFIEGAQKLICQSQNKLTILIREKIGWMIYQQIHETFLKIVWSNLYQFMITLNSRSQISVWQKNKRGQFQISSSEWDPDQIKNLKEMENLSVNVDGSLLFQTKKNKVTIWGIKQDGKLQEIFQQNIDDDNLEITSDFTNLIGQDEKSLIWYQLINDDL